MRVPGSETEYPLKRQGATVGLITNREIFPGNEKSSGKYGAPKRASLKDPPSPTGGEDGAPEGALVREGAWKSANI